MRARTWFVVLLGCNLLLGAGWFFSAQEKATPPQISTIYLRGSNYARTPVVNYPRVVVHEHAIKWSDIESKDYQAYIDNLRKIGCPEDTIRDIIVADVNDLYSRRQVVEVVSPDHEWWRTEPDLDAVEAAILKQKSLEAERQSLLTKLLGPGWDKPTNPLPPAVRTGINLSGPVLGELSRDVKEKLYGLTARSEQMVQEYRERMEEEGKPVDPTEIAKIQQQSRNEVAGLLTPAQMEEFLLRYSRTAETLRSELAGIKLSPEEFRALFRARDPIQQQMELQGTNLARSTLRTTLESQKEAILKQVLGPERFQEHKLNQDPVFQLARSTAERAGVSAESVMPLYRATQATQAEIVRINNDRNLSIDQKAAARAQVEATLQKSLRDILGAQAYDKIQGPEEE